jgi:hypothetical protein
MANDITTTKNERFSYEDSCDLAWMVYRRFGRDLYPATTAWNRLLQNNCDITQFQALVQHSRLNDEHEPYTCRLCGQHITDGKPCGCGARR